MAPTATEAARTWRRREENSVEDMIDILAREKEVGESAAMRPGVTDENALLPDFLTIQPASSVDQTAGGPG